MNFLEFFRKIHTHPVNIALHALAAVLFVSGLVLLLSHWKIAISLFILAVGSLGLGHWIEGSILEVFHALKHEKDKI